MYYETDDTDFIPIFKEKLKKQTSVLDIGSGLGVLLKYYNSKIILGLEIHRPYLEHRKNTSPHIIPINADARDMKKLFLPKSVSAITFIDSLEHFTKEDGLALLSDAEEIAINKIIVFTPRGFFPQNDIDHYGMKGEIYQSHYSGWEPKEFNDLGYEVTVFKDFHNSNNLAFTQAFGNDHPAVDAILAYKTLK